MWRPWICGLALASSLAPLAAAASPPVRLQTPHEGVALVSGEMATLSWTALPGGLAALEGPVEEWEAFLSLDGGRSYPFRLTPHLDLDVSTFRFEVPAVATDDARLLLRFGNESVEAGFEMPQRFSITVPPRLSAAPSWRLPIAASAAAGEAARPGDPGVRRWVEGDRRGRALKVRVAPAPWRLGSATIAPGPAGGLPVLAPKRDSWRQRPASLDPVARSPALGDAMAARPGGPRAAPILLLIRRSNR